MRHASPRSLFTVVLALALMLGPVGSRPAHAAYVVDYGDGLSITVKEAPQYNVMGGIRPDGIINIPYLADLDVRGLTTEQVRERVREVVGRVVHSPQVNVVVTSYRPRVVTVLGEVVRPGNVDISRADQSVIDTIATAGGFTEHALPAQVLVLRGNGAATRRIPVDVQYMMATGDLTGNVRLEPGDRVQVPRSPWPTWRDALGAMQTVAVITGAIVLLTRLGNILTP